MQGRMLGCLLLVSLWGAGCLWTRQEAEPVPTDLPGPEQSTTLTEAELVELGGDSAPEPAEPLIPESFWENTIALLLFPVALPFWTLQWFAFWFGAGSIL